MGKVRIGVRGSAVVVFFPNGTQLSKPIPEGMTGEQAIYETLKLLNFPAGSELSDTQGSSS